MLRFFWIMSQGLLWCESMGTKWAAIGKCHSLLDGVFVVTQHSFDFYAWIHFSRLYPPKLWRDLRATVLESNQRSAYRWLCSGNQETLVWKTISPHLQDVRLFFCLRRSFWWRFKKTRHVLPQIHARKHREDLQPCCRKCSGNRGKLINSLINIQSFILCSL